MGITMNSVSNINYLKLKRIGILPRYIESKVEKQEQLDKNKIPFSKHYRTYNDYIKDLKSVAEYTENCMEIPDSLVEKLEETLKELNIST